MSNLKCLRNYKGEKVYINTNKKSYCWIKAKNKKEAKKVLEKYECALVARLL